MIVKSENGPIYLGVFEVYYKDLTTNPHRDELLASSKFREEIQNAKHIEISRIRDKKDDDFTFFVLRQIAEFSNAERITISEEDVLCVGDQILSTLSGQNCNARIVVTPYDQHTHTSDVSLDHYPGSDYWKDWVIPGLLTASVVTYVMSKMPPEFFSGICNMFGVGDDVDLNGDYSNQDYFGD